MGLFHFLIVVQAIIAAALVGVILIQQSEGGGLGMGGGSPSGLMSARGAANFLTRATSILAFLFVGMAILLAVVAANRGGGSIDTSFTRTPAPVSQPAPGTPPLEGQVAPGAAEVAPGAASPAASPSAAPTTAGGEIPLGR